MSPPPARRPAPLLLLWLLPVLVLGLAAGCRSGPATTGLDDLVGSWRLTGVEIPAGAKIPTLTFGAHGAVNGTGGVNRFRGAVDAAGLAQGRWQLGDLSATRMAGPQEAMALEDSYLRALGSANRITLADGLLRLQDGEQVLLVFEPVRAR